MQPIEIALFAVVAILALALISTVVRPTLRARQATPDRAAEGAERTGGVGTGGEGTGGGSNLRGGAWMGEVAGAGLTSGLATKPARSSSLLTSRLFGAFCVSNSGGRNSGVALRTSTISCSNGMLPGPGRAGTTIIAPNTSK